ncbi:MAG: beta-phosphoglucomutase [Lachnospiraceae bacterium]|nr:beta-phosphoglucomutase [Lachnospiraceae bacterium]
MKNIRAVIFDLDGVLVFTDKYHYQAWKKVADRLGVPFDEEDNNRLRGVSREESLEIILEKYKGDPLSAEDKKKLTEEKNAIYVNLLSQMSREDVSRSVRRVLSDIRERGYKLAVGSSSKNAGLILEKTELKDAFDAVSDGNNITKSKPDPEVFLKGADMLCEAPEHCLVVEDAKAGILAGNAGGMYTAAIGDAVKSGKADYDMFSLSELLYLLD